LCMRNDVEEQAGGEMSEQPTQEPEAER